MRRFAVIARPLLGLVFIVFGLNGFFQFMPAPPPSGLWGAFTDVLFRSHYVMFVSGVQVVSGILLLTNQYAPLALVTLAAVLANILVFHVTMMPAGLPAALIVTLLWVIVALPMREHFAPLFARTAHVPEHQDPA